MSVPTLDPTKLLANAPRESVQDTSPEFVQQLLSGHRFGGSGLFSRAKFVWVTPMLDTLKWGKSIDDKSAQFVPASSILGVGYKEGKARTILIEFNNESSLELECESDAECSQWIAMLTWLKQYNSNISRPFNVQHRVGVSSDFQWSLPAGQSIESVFRLGECIGQGSFGRVMEATHIATGAELACKIITLQTPGAPPPSPSQGANTPVPLPVDPSTYKQELELMKQSRHKNVVSYFGCYGPDASNNLWIFMERCKFGSVIDLMHKVGHALDERQIAYVIGSTVAGLHYLHTSRQIVHRDIKGRNILIGTDGAVRLADFGVARKLAIPPSDIRELASGSGLPTVSTTVGPSVCAVAALDAASTVAAGSPHWMSPECIRDFQASFASDIWSLGISAIELTTGLPPRAELDAYQVMAVTVDHEPPTLPPHPCEIDPDYDPTCKGWSPEFVDFVTQCLQKDPLKRPTTADLLKHPFVRQGIADIHALDDIIAAVSSTTPALPYAVDYDPTALAAVAFGAQVSSPSNADVTPAGFDQAAANAAAANAAGRAAAYGSATQPTGQLSAASQQALASCSPLAFEDAFSTTAYGIYFPIPELPRVVVEEARKAQANGYPLAPEYQALVNRIALLREYAAPSFVVAVIGVPEIRGGTFSRHHSYPIRVCRNFGPAARPMPFASNSSEVGTPKLAKLVEAGDIAVVWRRYSDFDWLHETLTAAFPHLVVPPIPEKTSTKKFDEAVVKQRRQGLQWFLDRLIRHPVFSRSFLVHAFLVLEDTKLSDLKKYASDKSEDRKKKAKRNAGVSVQEYQRQQASEPGRYQRDCAGGMFYPLGPHKVPSEFIGDQTFLEDLEVPLDASVMTKLRTKMFNTPVASAIAMLPDHALCEVSYSSLGVLAKLLEQFESVQTKLAQQRMDEERTYQVLGELVTRVCDSASQGRKMLLHSVQQTTAGAQALLQCDPARTAVTEVTDLENLLGPALTLWGQHFSRVLAPQVTEICRRMQAFGSEPVSYYIKTTQICREALLRRLPYITQVEYELEQKVPLPDLTSEITEARQAALKLANEYAAAEQKELASSDSLQTETVPMDPAETRQRANTERKRNAAVILAPKSLRSAPSWQRLQRTTASLMNELSIFHKQKESDLRAVLIDLANTESYYHMQVAQTWSAIERDLDALLATDWCDLPLGAL